MLATWIVLAACAWCARSGPGPPTPVPPTTTFGPQVQSYTFHFAHPIYNMSIPENSGPRIYAAQPPDEDPLGIWLPPTIEPHSMRLRYRIRQGDKDKFFKAEERVVGDFGFLFIRTRAGNADVLNRERRDTYRLEIRATLSYSDNVKALSIGSFETDVVVVLTVTDVNDLGPLFYPTEYETVVPEDAPVHSSLTRVFAEDADLGSAGELYYSLDEPSDLFAVHPTTGVITLTRPLVHADHAEHHVTVVAQDRGSLLMRSSLPAVALASHTARARLTVRVRPVNLHAPHIDVEKQPELAENTPTGEIYAIVRVTDSDEGVHGEIANLEIVDGDPDGHFRVKASGRPGEFEVRVHTLLDRERTPRGYNLTLRATDAGIPPRTSYRTLTVRLADVNDNTPVFGREIYEASVSESAPPGTPLVRLKVTDADTGRNARVYIEIVGGNEEGEFHVNPDTGMLYTAVSLDAETRARYTLTVSAVDQGGTGLRRQSSAKVEVTVLDANDNDPVFERDELLVDLDENRPSGALVARLTARDIDSGENGYVSYSVANLRPVPFEVDHFTGAVRTTRLLDYETMRREYVLRVRASDWGTPYRRQAEMRLTVHLRDLNDNRPEFERVDCEGHLPRGLPAGIELFTLSAIDLDAGSVVSYRLVAGNDDGCFALDSATGVLSLACDLSDVRDDMHVLNVTATDGTHFADTTSMVLHLVRASAERRPAFECRDTGVARRLTDTLASAERANAPLAPTLDEFALTPSRYGENVHAPEFIDFPVEIKVNESTALGTTLVRLRARDRDLGYNGLLAYVISAGDPDSAFRIDPDTGDLTLIGYLDREREPDYYLNVTVYDLGRPPRTVSRLLPITVLDINDNTPVFEKSLASFRVTENALNGTAVFHANATDRDEGDFARVQYSLSDNADLDFCIERDSGILRVCAPLDRERRALYELVIRAMDGGGLYAEALVRVVVDDINDNAPAFGLSTWAARVREDVPIGTLVAVVEARDPDLGAGGRISYTLADATEDAAFAIDAASGVLRTIAPLDFEQRQVYGVAIRATDGGHPPLWSEAVVIVEILDVDENVHAPQFVERVFSGTVRENSPPGTNVLVVNATDADPSGRDSRLAYYLLAGSGLGRFTIDDAGEVRTVAPLDREMVAHYWLTVCAQDHGLAPRHTCVQLYVEVLDENDIVPWPELAAYETEVPEHCTGGTQVIRVLAHDSDASTGPPTSLAYRIVAGNPDGLFTIDEASDETLCSQWRLMCFEYLRACGAHPVTPGQVPGEKGEIRTTGRALDREAAAEHALEVRVSDGQLACSARVVVRLADLNDHAPSFLEPLTELRLPVDGPPHDINDDGSDSVDWDSETETDEADDDGWHNGDGVRGLLVATV
ncbi:Fat-like cadherin-related tumor suppressor homolog [Eumeta japonica]|uniref:Fat-like cadherin-related tumor suppressor homolog n=1 Tax=Eumeta variegata TaxID=151549 RepID=A0A4C1YYD1_EUMVA|nr:Fat-like cadherin-related tumor suppressor homolog [Eumeta japonica]